MPLSIEQIEAAVSEHGSMRAAAAALGVADSTIRRRLKNAGISTPSGTHQNRPEKPEKSGVTVDHEAGAATVISEPSAAVGGSVEELIRENGLDPEDWHVVNTTLNKWNGLGKAVDGVNPIHVLRQVKVTLRSRKLLATLVRPAALPPIDLPESRPFKPTTDALGILTACWQWPYADEVFHGLFLQMLRDVKPAFGIDHGDGPDFATISRHSDDPATWEPAQASIDGYTLDLYKRRQASPDTAWRLLFGNHDIRLMSEALQRSERIAGIRPGLFPGEEPQLPLLSLQRAFRTDELGIEVVAPPHGSAKYHAAECVVSPHYIAIHGVKTDSKAAARLTVEQYGCNVSMGHTHRQRLFSVRLQRGPMAAVDATGVEVGCGMEIGGRGAVYANRPDWANGAMTVSLDDDGHPFFEPIRYRNGVLSWRDYRWKA